MRFIYTSMCVVALLIAGCDSGAKRIKPPKIDASDAATKAMELFDKDNDGIIAGDELESSPGLANAISRIDNDGDGKISKEELKARITSWMDSKAGALPATLSLMMKGKPVADAEVTLEPEPFLEGFISNATGKSDYMGLVELSCADVTGGIQVGLYRVRVSKKKGDKETIPAKFNEDTTLGVEIFSAAPAVSTTMGERIELK